MGRDIFAVLPKRAPFSPMNTCLCVGMPRGRGCRARHAFAGLLIIFATCASAAITWVPGAGGSWAAPANWDSGTVPNAVGESVVFNTPAAVRAVTMDSGAAGHVVGSLTFNNDSSFNMSVTTGTAGSNLKLDSGGAGSSITVNGFGTGNVTISSPLVLNDTVTAAVNGISATSGAGNLNLTAAISGFGGFVKIGPGLATFGTGLKTYTGPTVIADGRMRMSATARPANSSSVTVAAGGQLTLIVASGSETYTLGPGPLTLNGSGPVSFPYSQFPGAIRNDRGLVTTITNPVILESDSLIHVQVDTGTLAGSTTLSGGVSGPGGLSVNAPSSDAFVGSVILTGPGTYTGSTVVNSGTLRAASTTDSAMGGTTFVYVRSGQRIGLLELGASNQIHNEAPLVLESAIFNTGGFSDTLGALSINVAATIDLADGNSILRFANSTSSFWGGALNIYNWSGNPGIGSGIDQLFFGTDATGLTSAQLGQITFYIDAGLTLAGTGPAMILQTGEVVPIPEPASASLLLASLAFAACARVRQKECREGMD